MSNVLVHSKVDPKADGPDATIVRPSDWNADHVISGGVTYHGADPTGSADSTTAIQTAMNEAGPEGNPVALPTGDYKVTTLAAVDGASLIAEGRAVGQPLGVRLVGTPGYDILTFDATGYKHASFKNIDFTGGRRSISVTAGPAGITYVTFEDCDIGGGTAESAYLEGHCEEWNFVRCHIHGGTYGLRFGDVGDGAGSSLFDKSSFRDCTFAGATINLIKIEADYSNNTIFDHCIFNTAGRDGIWLDGGIRGMAFYDCNTEANGQTGKANRTTLTGTVSSGATSGTLASIAGGGPFGTDLWANGDTITIQGAGSNGQDLTTTITSLVGTAVGWSAATSTTVAAPRVTNAIYDDVHLANTVSNPFGIRFVGGTYGGEGGTGIGGHLRYALYDPGFGSILDGVTGTDTVAFYDGGRTVALMGGATGYVRRPNRNATQLRYATEATRSTDNSQRDAVAVSPAGGDYVVVARDSLDNGSGTYGVAEWRRSDSNRTRYAYLNPTTGEMTTTGNIEIDMVSGGLILKSPNGTRYIAKIANGGTWTITAA